MREGYSLFEKISLLYEILKSPILFYDKIRMLKDIRKYMRMLVIEALEPALSRMPIGKEIPIEKLMKVEGYVDGELLLELLRFVEEEGVIRVKQGKIVLLREAPERPFSNMLEKMHPKLLEAFGTFGEPTVKVIRARLSGDVDEVGSAELRVYWSIALGGEFYRIQRDKAIRFSRVKEEAGKRAGTFRLLDYGCGSGEGTVQLFNHLSEVKDELEIDGCDVSEELLRMAREDTGLGLPIHFFSLKEERPAEGRYDAIFISHVLHWLEDPVRVVGELKSYLKPDGFIFGVESTISDRLYPVDLFIRLYGAKGFPTFEELQRWFGENNMKLNYDPVWFSFKATQV